jgi:hypothetical protein
MTKAESQQTSLSGTGEVGKTENPIGPREKKLSLYDWYR